MWTVKSSYTYIYGINDLSSTFCIFYLFILFLAATVYDDVQTCKHMQSGQCCCSLLVLSQTLQVNQDLCFKYEDNEWLWYFLHGMLNDGTGWPSPPHLPLTVSVLSYFVSEPLLLLLIWSELNLSELWQLWQLCAWNDLFADRFCFVHDNNFFLTFSLWLSWLSPVPSAFLLCARV